MCNFLSAIVLKNGDVKWHELTDSHHELISHFGLPDKNHIGHFAKVEFTPPKKEGRPIYEDWKNYKLRVDEDTKPQWFEDVEKSVIKKLQSIIRDMIVDDARPLVLGGCRILVTGAKVETIKSSRVVSMSGTSRVGSMSGTSSVGSMYDTSSVGSMSGTSRVGSMYDTSRAPNDPTNDKRVKAATKA